MKIELLHAYKGKPSNYEKLLAGVQSVSDELGAYLVANGHAIALEANPAIGLDLAVSGEDSTIETLVELSHDAPATVPTVKPTISQQRKRK